VKEDKEICAAPVECSARCQCVSYGSEVLRPFHAVLTRCGVLWVEILEALLQDFVSKEFYYDLLNAMITRKSI
jgi:hypothetical protein